MAEGDAWRGRHVVASTRTGGAVEEQLTNASSYVAASQCGCGHEHLDAAAEAVEHAMRGSRGPAR